MTGGADLSKFTLSSANALTFNVATDYETPLDSGADNVYTTLPSQRRQVRKRPR